jgi:hypothetical protein
VSIVGNSCVFVIVMIAPVVIVQWDIVANCFGVPT